MTKKKYFTEEERKAAQSADTKRFIKSHPDYAKRRNNYRLEHPEYMRNYFFQRKYGITLDDYNKMFMRQKGCCAICGKHQSEMKKKLFVDHDHRTGEVRALLCQHCNTAIGLLNDDVSLLQKAINYLKS